MDIIYRNFDERYDAIVLNKTGYFGFEHQSVSEIAAFRGGIRENHFDINPFGIPVDIGQDNYGAGVFVRDNSARIEAAANEFGISQDLLKAVIFTETARGWYDKINPLGSNTILPGNVSSIWEPLIPGSNVHDVGDNIRLSAKLLSEISSRLKNPYPEDVYSLYNSLSHDRTYQNGELKSTPYFMLRAMQEKAWQYQSWSMEAADGLVNPKCFPSGTEISLSNGRKKPIENVAIGDAVAAFSDASSSAHLSPKPVTRLFTNITDTWIKLSNGITVTPGHHFLDSKGGFSTIEAILADDGIVIDAAGEELSVTGEYIHYSAETADLYEQAEGYVAANEGGLALAPVYKKGWKTYNFEVADYHTYVAGGVRVHNQSVFTATGKDVTVGTKWTSADGKYHYVQNADGSVTNLDTGRTTDGAAFAHAKLESAEGYNMTPAQQTAAANQHVFAQVERTGSGPSVTTSSGATTTVDTVFMPSNGYEYTVNSNGSTTSSSGHTYGNGTRKYDPDTNSWYTVGQERESSGGSGGSISSLAGSSGNSGQSSQSSGSQGGKSSQSDHGSSSGSSSSSSEKEKSESSSSSSSKPILIDLDGDGVAINQLSSSNFFFDMDGDGKQNRTAWAAAGDGVLVRDEGNDGVINLKQEIDFTSWAPSAKSDLEALRMAFDSNHDGKLSSADDEWSLFKVLVTNADGTTVLKTLAELGIVSIDLISNNQEINLSDGSKIKGSTTYTKSDSSKGIVADAVLSFDANNYLVAKTVTVNGDGSTTIENVATRPDGSIANTTNSTISADGNSRTTTFDNNGDGVVDHIQTEVRVVNGDGSITETLEDLDSSGSILQRRAVTQTSADGKTVTVSIDFDGSGTYDRVETRVTGVDGSLTLTVENRNANGSMHDSQTTITSADGLQKTVEVELTATGGVNATKTVVTTVAGDGTRTETVSNYAGNATTVAHKINGVVTVTAADGTSKTVATDLDGDGDVDVTTASALVVNGDGSRTTTETSSNGDSSLRTKSTTLSSADGNSKTVEIDIDGDGTYDQKTIDATVINGDGSRDRTITKTFANSDLANKSVESWSADGKTRTITIDTDGDGNNDRIQTIADVSGSSVDTSSVYSANGATLISRSVTTTSADGLVQTSKIDRNGDSTDDTTQIVINGDGSSTITSEVLNGAGTVSIGKTVETRSADGLTGSVTRYRNGSTDPFEKATSVKVHNGDGSITQTMISFAGANLVQTGKTVIEISADRLTTVQKSYIGTNTLPATISTSVTATDGSVTETVESYSRDGATLVGKTIATTSSDGLSQTVTIDADGDGDIDATTQSVKTLNADGSVTTTSTSYNGDATLSANTSGQTVITTSGNGLTVTKQTDANGDGVFDSKLVETTVLNADGSRTKTAISYNGDGTIQTGKTVTTVSDDGLVITSASYLGDHTAADGTSTQITVLNADGSTVTTLSQYAANAALLSRTITTKSGDGLSATTTIDSDGDGVVNRSVSATSNANGSVTSVTSTFTAAGVLESKSTETVSADGLSRTVIHDVDADATTDRSTTDVVTLNADGSSTRVLSAFDAASVLQNKTTITTTADGLSTTTVWEGEGAGTTRSQTRTALINADGSTTKTVSNFNANGSLHDKTITIASADGATVRTTRDINGDGTVDETIVQNRLADGTVLTSNMVGTVQSASGREYGATKGQYTTTSADGHSATTRYDANGDGLAESQTTDVTVRNADGSVVRTISSAALSGGVASSANPAYTVTPENQTVITTSANGRTVTTEWDKDGNGSFENHRTEQTVFETDGSSTTTIELYDGAVLTSRFVTSTSADGLISTSQRDINGDGSIDEVSTSVMVRNGDGSTTNSVTNTTASGTLISKTEVTTSADGLTTTRKEDPDGTGSFTRIETVQSETLADGTQTTTIAHHDAASTLLDRTVSQISGDGLETIIRKDADGDGIDDQVRIVNQLVDGSSTTTVTDYETNGSKKSELTTHTSADGLLVTSEKDTDGDGIIDRTTNHTWRYFADGSSEELLQTYQVSQKDGNGVVTTIAPVLQQTAKIITSADGRTTTSTVDINGDGTTDETSITILAIDGSTLTTTTDNADARALPVDDDTIQWASYIATGSPTIAYTTKTTVSADGLTKVVEADYDGNGTFEHKEVWKTRIDGSQIAAITDVNGSGAVVAAGTMTISADGRTTTLLTDSNNDGVLDVHETSVLQLNGHATKNISMLSAGAGNDILLGSSGTDNLSSGAGSDIIYGRGGNDTLNGGTGADILIGGAGDDIYFVDNIGDSVTETSGEGTDEVRSSISYTLEANVENLTLTGSTALNGAGNSSNNILSGNSANNTLEGGSGNDVLIGGAGADVLNGGAGTDMASYITATSGVHVDMTGLAGDGHTSITHDSGWVGTAWNTGGGGTQWQVRHRQEGQGNNERWVLDSFVYWSGSLVYYGGGESSLPTYFSHGGYGYHLGSYINNNGTGFSWYTYRRTWIENYDTSGDAKGDAYVSIEALEGSNFDDRLVFEENVAGTIYGRGGNDVIVGGNLSDTLEGGSGADSLNGGTGTDTVRYGSSTVAVYVDLLNNIGLYGEAQGDTFSSIEGVVGTDYDDYLRGDNGTSFLYGGAGNDELRGEGGNDTLEGGSGDDWLVGGSGNDTFVFRAGSGNDGVADFEVHNGTANGDVIELHDQSVTSFAALMANATEWAGDSYINLDGGAEIKLYGVTLSQLSADDFAFA